MKNEKILDWVQKNYKNNPNESMSITAKQLYRILKEACREQFELDKKQFNEIIESAFSATSGEAHQA